jgi:hypothetical protein
MHNEGGDEIARVSIMVYGYVGGGGFCLYPIQSRYSGLEQLDRQTGADSYGYRGDEADREDTRKSFF